MYLLGKLLFFVFFSSQSYWSTMARFYLVNDLGVDALGPWLTDYF